MDTKHITAAARFELKAANADAPNGEVVALVSVFNNVDYANDRVMPGAFAESIQWYADNAKSIPFVWSHQWDNPDAYIGKVISAQETPDGLQVRAALFSTATAEHVRTLMKEGVVTEFSFAYDILDQGPAADGANELRKLHILEAGPTLKGMNPATRLVGVRSASVEMPTASSTAAKAGRVLSSKNEDRIRNAVELLGEVLTTLETVSDTTKAEEPAAKADEVKAERDGSLDPKVAQLLIELAELD